MAFKTDEGHADQYLVLFPELTREVKNHTQYQINKLEILELRLDYYIDSIDWSHKDAFQSSW